MVGMTRVKVCGVTNVADARAVADLGVWAIGMIFHPPSPRACDPDAAQAIGAELHRRTELAGVFVNAPLDELAELAELASLTVVQLHGDEGQAYCREVARRTGCKVMKALPAADAATVRRLDQYPVDLHMLDAHVRGRRGGTGETFPWELARERRSGIPLVVSGGIDAENAPAAIEATSPFAVDSASGTEAAPGRKDLAKVRSLLRAAEQASEPVA